MFKQKNVIIAALAFSVVCFVGLVVAQSTTKFYHSNQRNEIFKKDVFMQQELGMTESAVTLTSPTVAFSAVGLGLVGLTSSANQTGIHPTDGETGQLLIIRNAAAGTERFDDNATTMALGANITLGIDDVLALRCLSGGSGSHCRWGAEYTHDN